MKKNISLVIAVFIVCVIVLNSCTKEKATPAFGACNSIISYSATIKPIIDTYCVGCHSPGNEGNGDYQTNPYEGLLQKVNSGALFNRVILLKDMPKAGSDPLTDEQRNKIYCWIQQGAPNN